MSHSLFPQYVWRGGSLPSLEALSLDGAWEGVREQDFPGLTSSTRAMGMWAGMFPEGPGAPYPGYSMVIFCQVESRHLLCSRLTMWNRSGGTSSSMPTRTVLEVR